MPKKKLGTSRNGGGPRSALGGETDKIRIKLEPYEPQWRRAEIGPRSPPPNGQTPTAMVAAMEEGRDRPSELDPPDKDPNDEHAAMEEGRDRPSEASTVRC